MAKTITIYVQLNDATLQGRRSLKLSGSTCRLGIVPRELMRDTLSNPKLNEQLLDKYSFYMLLSDDSSFSAYSVYIGKARSFSERVLSHLREKPYWHTALVFNSSDPSFLTDTEINYLEHLGIKLAKELHPELTENAVVPAKPAIPPEREDEMDEFFEDIKLLTGFYGCTVFEELASIETLSSIEKNLTLSIPLEPGKESSVRISPLKNENIKHFYVFHIDKPKGIYANLYYNHEENRYIIAKGSVIKAIDGEIRPNLLRMRQEVISNPDLSVQNGDYYELKADIELLKSSRSDSASFCTGVSTNGNKAWVDSRGLTFKEVFPK